MLYNMYVTGPAKINQAQFQKTRCMHARICNIQIALCIASCRLNSLTLSLLTYTYINYSGSRTPYTSIFTMITENGVNSPS